MTTIRPVVLCGGAGTRLWPLSRRSEPKQLLPLASQRTLLQDTLLRVRGGSFETPVLVGGEADRFLLREQAREVQAFGTALLEPMGKNTAPAVALAALRHPDELLLVLPADHVVDKPDAFLDAVNKAVAAATAGHLVTFGIQPDHAATGFGWIQVGELVGAPGVHRVDRFVEKPDHINAERMLAAGGYAWNGGMFLFQAGTFLKELEAHRPDVMEAARAAETTARTVDEFVHYDADVFSEIPSVSIDYAVMERTDRAAVVPVDMAWSDVGSFGALWKLRREGVEQNVVHGDCIVQDCKRSYIRSEGPLVTATGVEDLVIVATPDAVLVAPRGRDQSVKGIVETLRGDERLEADWHPTVRRPWGSYLGLDADDGYQVKRIVVRPGQQLSLQKHAKRAEHWVVVQGEAVVTQDEKVSVLGPGQHAFIEVGMVHRLENHGKVDLVLIEVQCGSYLGEDDIERLEDVYGRVE